MKILKWSERDVPEGFAFRDLREVHFYLYRFRLSLNGCVYELECTEEECFRIEGMLKQGQRLELLEMLLAAVEEESAPLL